MHVLYFHQRFPAQFGHIARRLVERGIECTYVSEQLPATVPGLGPVRYETDFAAGEQLGSRDPTAPPIAAFQFTLTDPLSTAVAPAATPIDGIRVIHYPAAARAPVTFDEQLGRGLEVYRYLKSLPALRPDVVVGSGNFGSTLFLPDLYHCPLLHYGDYYYRADDSYLHFRPEFPPSDEDIFRARAYNALVLLDLQTCIKAYTPTAWQKSLYPKDYHSKITTLFDGVDRGFWYRRQVPRRIGAGPALAATTRIVTYVARGLEALRGFDIFMKVAQRIARARSDVLFVVVGSDHFYHGPDLRHIQAPSFLEHVCRQDQYDLSRFTFVGRVPSSQLVEILSLSDLHLYWTAPFVLSWSLFDALACGCTVLASNTSPVREVIQHDKTGLLCDFYDVDGFTRQALRVLDDPDAFRSLGQNGVKLIDERYSLERTIPAMVQLLQATAETPWQTR
jgi:glycosyltransferase involved in cell wall biosynthesis